MLRVGRAGVLMPREEKEDEEEKAEEGGRESRQGSKVCCDLGRAPWMCGGNRASLPPLPVFPFSTCLTLTPQH